MSHDSARAGIWSPLRFCQVNPSNTFHSVVKDWGELKCAGSNTSGSALVATENIFSWATTWLVPVASAATANAATMTKAPSFMMTCLPRRFYRASFVHRHYGGSPQSVQGADDPRGAARVTAPFDRFAKAYW